MKKRHIVIPLLLILTAIGSFIAIFYLFNGLEKQITEIKSTPEFLQWLNSTIKEYDFDHPYVSCIMNKTCNGTFQVRIDVNGKNLSQLTNFLNIYGKIKAEYVKGGNEYTILFETGDIYKINNFLSLAEDIKIDKINSDYHINIPLDEMKKCQRDNECVKIMKGCCGCQTDTINKKYIDLWKSQFYCHNQTCILEVCAYNSDVLCQQSICAEADIMKCNADSDCVSGMENCINKNLAPRLHYSTTALFNCKCKENQCVGTLKIPIITNITSPINNSIITTKETYINVTTNRSATCDYSSKIKNGDSLIGTEQRPMNFTDGTNHSQLIENLQNAGYYAVEIKCHDSSGNSEKTSVNFWSRIDEYLNLSGRFIGEETRGGGLILKTDLPILLKDGLFQYSNGPDAQYTFILSIGSKPIEHSTHNGILESPNILVNVGTDYNKYLYKYDLTFSKSVNFTKQNNEGADWWITLLGDNYKVAEGSTNQKIILNKDFSENNFIMEDEQPLKINDEVIHGTYVKFNEGFLHPPQDSIATIDIYFAMPPNKDYIAVGESWNNPFFQNVRYFFKSYSETNGAEIYFGQIY